MKTDLSLTTVTFRQFPEGAVIAIFVNEIADAHGNLLSYQTIGQHGACCPTLLDELPLAKPKAAQKLKKELERIGYALEVL